MIAQQKGVALSQPNNDGGTLEDSQLKKMLSKDLTWEEKEACMEVLKQHSNLFILAYEHITGVTVMQHHIRIVE